MLSAVEIHSGPGGIGIYSNHLPYGRPSQSVSSTILQPMPLPPTSTHHQSSPMSGSEFARPKPKSIGVSLNGSGLSSSALSPTQKYSQLEQPVNLAVNHHQNSSRNSAAPLSPSTSHSKELSDQKEIDVVGLGSSSNSIGPVPMSYATTSSRISYPTGLGTNAYQALNYSFYGNRYGAPIFPHRSPYSQHHSSRPTYLPSQLDTYSPYALSAAPYSSNSVGGYSNIGSPQLPPPSNNCNNNSSSSSSSSTINNNSDLTSSPVVPQQKSTSERSHSMSSLSNGHHHHHHPYVMKEKEPKSAGPRLVGSVDDTRNNNNFKVPSGKEGSLKHRILTSRPSHGDKHGTINHPANRSPGLNNNSHLNFTRGSLIELSNGDYRRVEDLRTEDFVMSAEKSQDLQLADSTVVKILPASNNFVIITFSYDNNRSKVDIEAKLEHPFFVYGQGWASCNPDGSMEAFGLKCQRLQVGDVCISLKPRVQKLESNSPLSPQKQRSLYHHQLQQQQYHHAQQQQQAKEMESIPQNLSRRPQTIPTTATDTSMSSRQELGPYSPSIYSLQMSLFAAAQQGHRMASYASYLNEESSSGGMLHGDLNTSNDKLPQTMMSKNNPVDDYDDDLQSRKRRWSAPDIADEDQQPRKIAN